MTKQSLIILLSAILVFAGGCSGIFSGKKSQELPHEKLAAESETGKTTLVSDCTTLGNFYPIAVTGFGLVTELPGTGGEDPNTVHYQAVYDDMNRRGIRDIRAILASPQTAVVQINGVMRPGIQAGDRFDIQIVLPPETNVKSIRGGKLLDAKLTEMAYLGGNWRQSSTFAYAAGAIMVDDPMATESTNPDGLKRGVILGGAVAKEARSLMLNMKTDLKSALLTDRIAKTINHRFYLPTGQHKGVATAKTDALILLDVHPSYVSNVARYVKVIQSIACYESPAQQTRRIERLKEELLNPNTAQQAAFQLEAIGKPGIEPLKQALKSSDREIRFHAATSLAYLGDGSSADVLTEIAQTSSEFRVYALKALSVLQNSLDAESDLRDLLHDPNAETRYGAFRALKARNSSDQTIRGEVLGGQFYYHGINSQTVPMVHLTTQKLPEVVLFGNDILLKQPFSLDAGPIFFVNGQTPGTVVVSRLAVSGVDEKRTVSNRLDEIIRAVIDMGGTYPDIVQMIRQADTMRVLSCRLEMNCLPEPDRIYRRQGSTETEVAVEEEKPKAFWERMSPKNLFAPNPGANSSDFTGSANTSSRD